MPDTKGWPLATVSIYQNPDHVAGLLQQIYVAPLLKSETQEGGTDEVSGEKTDQRGSGGLDVGGALPFLGKVGADIAGEAGRSAESGLTASSRLTRNFEYSQAYYLHVVRAALRNAGALKSVTSAGDAHDLRSGDFVEYQATFRPNEINALLDILTPDLIAAITHYAVNSVGIRQYTEYEDNLEGLQIFAAQNQADAQAKSDIARSVAQAVRVDFRSVKTREFYGSIGAGDQEVTAVTICDNPHFVVDDEDRILDGEFTVLGKVTSATTTDEPILERNKVLRRVRDFARKRWPLRGSSGHGSWVCLRCVDGR
jgi:hypothetical protein